MINGKDWLAGQNWIGMFQSHCENMGNVNRIQLVTNGFSVYNLMCDYHRTFPEPPEGDDVWCDRALFANHTEHYELHR